MKQRFAPALNTLRKLFESASTSLRIPIRFALIGGLAVSAWGVVRATQDIDLLADSDPSPLSNLALRKRLQDFLEQRDCTAEWRVGDPDDPIPLLLRLGVHRPVALVTDILWAHKKWHREALSRRVTLKISRLEIFVLHPEDLILMKLEAGGPQDLLDVEALLSNPPPELDLKRLKRRTVQLGLGAAELDRCLRR
ncbi:MAG: nucleotidyl transferase AbiEii/AbiGii toxin family protein [Candidatus Binatia bacterium]